MKFFALLLGVTLVGLLGCSPTTYDHGVPNFAQVDTFVWRSGQPTTEAAWAYIKQRMGTKRVHVIKLNFDREGSDSLAASEGFLVNDLSIEPEGDRNVVDAVLNTIKAPDMARVEQAEAMLATAGPDDGYLVHCTHGQDRTGLVVGIYRLRHGWSRRLAYQEMRDHHFHPELIGLSDAWEDAK